MANSLLTLITLLYILLLFDSSLCNQYGREAWLGLIEEIEAGGWHYRGGSCQVRYTLNDNSDMVDNTTTLVRYERDWNTQDVIGPNDMSEKE